MTVSSIEWTDRTWNPVRGCTRVSEGCRNCYAERQAARNLPGSRSSTGVPFALGTEAGPRWTGQVELVPLKLDEPIRWRKPARVFVNSMSDLFHESLDEASIDTVFAAMVLAPRHTFQVLTKRAYRMRAYMEGLAKNPADRLADAASQADVLSSEDVDVLVANIVNGWSWWRDEPERGVPLDGTHKLWPLPNVHLGVSVENQDQIQRIDHLGDVPAVVRFVSFEPLLEDLGALILDGVDWCIFGGESGPGARDCNVDWIARGVRECRRQSVPAFVKQLGTRPTTTNLLAQKWPTEMGYRASTDGVYHLTLDDPKGGDPREWREDLQVRQFPCPSTLRCTRDEAGR